MKKVLAIAQLIIGIIVVLFALTMFWQALSNIIPQLKDFLKASDLPYVMTIDPFSKWLQLIVSVFTIQVIAVYTKGIFDQLSVSK